MRKGVFLGLQVRNVSPKKDEAKLQIFSIMILPANRTFGSVLSIYAQNIQDL
jgi:hypothetical protein